MRYRFFRFTILSSAFVLCGCNCDTINNSVLESDSDTTLSTTSFTYPVTTTLVSTTYTTCTSLTMSSMCSFLTSQDHSYDFIETSTVCDNDFEVLDYFSRLGDSVKRNFDSDELLEKGKFYFIYCVDFLFYDTEINGIKFNDLTDSAKEQLLRDICTIDSLICSKYPNYKDDIKEGYGNAYNKASDVIKVGSENINEFSRDKLGEENYNKLKEYKDLFVDTAFGDWNDFVDILGKGKQKLKDWYEGLK